jgi:rhodanese-related sulfurtransferase
MRPILYIFAFCLSATTFAQDSLDELLRRYNEHSAPYISVTELRRLQFNDWVTLFDGREKKEYNVSHIPNAEHVGYDNFSMEEISKAFPDKGEPIVVYCTIGIRSEDICMKLIKAGYTNVRNLYGGICEWKNNLYPVIDSTRTETENVHTYSKQWSKWLNQGVMVYD